MAIEGPLRELGIHDVFQLLDLSRKTGRLRVSSALRDNEGTVQFRDGKVVAASIRSNPHPLGAVLLRDGRITEAELARARATQDATPERRLLGELLVEAGVITARELERYIRRQVEAVVFELLSWQEGFFSFAEGEVEGGRPDGLTAVGTETLLMEGARRLDEWTQIQQRVPHLGVVPRLAALDEARNAPLLDLLPSEWEVLAAVDGERDLRSIASTLKRGEFEVARTAFGLVATGIVELVAPARREVAPPVARPVEVVLADAREAMHQHAYEDAISHAATAVALAPDNADARFTLARVLIKQGREPEAEEELRHALRANPDHCGAMMETARIAVRRGALSEASHWWERVIAAAPHSAEAEQSRQAMSHATQLEAVLAGADA